jgi:hypothetical protein
VIFPNIQLCKILFLRFGNYHLYYICFLKLARFLLIGLHTGMTRKHEQRNLKMTISTRNQIASVFAAVACAFLTIGVSVAPAVSSVAPYLA